MDGQTKDWIRQTIQNEQLTFSNVLIKPEIGVTQTLLEAIRSSAWLNCIQANRGDPGTDNNFSLCKRKYWTATYWTGRGKKDR